MKANPETRRLRLMLPVIGAALLVGCDFFDIDPDPVVEDEPVVRETPEERRRNEELVLRGGTPKFPKGTRLKDTHRLSMDHLGIVIMEDDEVTMTGSAKISYDIERDINVLSPSIWRMELGAMGTTTTVKFRRDESELVTEERSPLEGSIIIQDGSRYSMESVATPEQKEALANFDAAWFGGDTIFAEEGKRRRSEWVIKPEVMLGAIFGKTFTDGSGSAHLSVEKTMEFDGQDVAEVRVSIERCRATTTGPGGETLEVELHGYGTLHRHLDPLHTTRVDLEGDAKITEKVEGKTTRFTGPFECRVRSQVSS